MSFRVILKRYYSQKACVMTFFPKENRCRPPGLLAGEEHRYDITVSAPFYLLLSTSVRVYKVMFSGRRAQFSDRRTPWGAGRV